ncbi:hypothetical protein F8203_gp034 [Heliothis virescens ascovirus 3f]|uniref:Uncharacterized protein n=1 Tax=Heliothis virescens ascovirus 3f TaxID=328614 RepID=A0A171PVD3_9VIRU|nr:hypothetical protein F8203_gp034 [Heliothis virescens ascovirus 3f]AJP09000.1 hypothetical protein [Heliothis virescens ascovirus 3f]
MKSATQLLENLLQLEAHLIDNDIRTYRIANDYTICDNMKVTLVLLFKNMYDWYDDLLDLKLIVNTSHQYDLRVKLALRAIVGLVGCISRDYVYCARHLLNTLRFADEKDFEILPCNFTSIDMWIACNDLCLVSKTSSPCP